MKAVGLANAVHTNGVQTEISMGELFARFWHVNTVRLNGKCLGHTRNICRVTRKVLPLTMIIGMGATSPLANSVRGWSKTCMHIRWTTQIVTDKGKAVWYYIQRTSSPSTVGVHWRNSSRKLKSRIYNKHTRQWTMVSHVSLGYHLSYNSTETHLLVELYVLCVKYHVGSKFMWAM